MRQKQSKQQIIKVHTKTSKAHQTVVPAEIRKMWGFKGELVLTWYYNPTSQAVSLEAIPTEIDEWLDQTSGMFHSGRTKEQVDQDLEDMRNEWD